MIPTEAPFAHLPGPSSDFIQSPQSFDNFRIYVGHSISRPSGSKANIVSRATVHLLEVYKNAKPGFEFQRTLPRRCLTNPPEPVSNSSFDNSSHDLILRVDDVMKDPSAGDEYVVVDSLGTGTFGQVAKCLHKQSSTFVAVKIVKNQQAYFNQAWVEINILRMLHRNNSSEDSRHIVRFFNHFIFRGHLCLVFEKLSINLYELLKQNRYAGVSMETLRTFLGQLLKALAVLVKYEVIHCDVKPENILISSVEKAELKLIDFGSACQLQHPVYTYVQSRFYRSPEILLGSPTYDSKIDMWSLGCVAGELFLGIPMFPGQDGMNMICRITEMVGDFPDMFLRRCGLTSKFYNVSRSGDDIRVFRLKSVHEYEEENSVKLSEWKRYFKERRLRDIIMTCAYQSQPPSADEVALRESLVDLLSGMLKIDPLDRWTPAEALQHPFITTGPLPSGQPWHPPGRPRRYVARSRPVAIDALLGMCIPDTHISASAPNFAAHGLFSHSFTQPAPSDLPGLNDSTPQMPGSGSYIPGPSFPAFQSANNQYTPENPEDRILPSLVQGSGEPSASMVQDEIGAFDVSTPPGSVLHSSQVSASQVTSPRSSGVLLSGCHVPGSDDAIDLSRYGNPGNVEESLAHATRAVGETGSVLGEAAGVGFENMTSEMEDSVFGTWSDDDIDPSANAQSAYGVDMFISPAAESTSDTLMDVENPDVSMREIVPQYTPGASRPPLQTGKMRGKLIEDNMRKK